MVVDEQAVVLAATPLVSIIVLSYNHERFIIQCLDSIKAQTYKNYELIIVDDCSADRSVQLIQEWIGLSNVPVTFIANTHNQGICRSMNAALALVNGAYLATNASDDTWMPEKLNLQVEELEAAPPTVGVLYSDAYLIDEEGMRLPGSFLARQRSFDKPPEGRLFAELIRDNFIPANTVLIRRECLDRVRPYDEALTCEDWDFWLRASQDYDFMYSEYVSAEYRLVRGSASASVTTRVIEDWVRILLKPWRTDRIGKRRLRRRLRMALGQLFARDHPRRLEYLRQGISRDPHPVTVLLYCLARLGVSGAKFRGRGAAADRLMRGL